jgi:Domain of unknown function (DUF4386)
MASTMRNSELAGASPLVHARVAGLVAVVVLASGTFAGVVASKLVVRGDAAATARNFVASESLLRLGLVSSLIMMIAFILYALLLYRLLGRVNKSHAMIMVGLALASVPIYMLNQVNQFAALLLAEDQQYAQVKLFLDLHRLGNLIAGIFFGLWLFPLGLLVFRSRFFPRILGVLLMFRNSWLSGAFCSGVSLPGIRAYAVDKPVSRRYPCVGIGADAVAADSGLECWQMGRACS